MNVLVVHCHPHEDSFNRALLERVLAGLEASGHEVDLLDLYAEGFDPVLSREDWTKYMNEPERLREGDLADHVARLERAEGLVFVFPTWFFSVPSLLKGWFERVWLPGVAFEMPDGGGPARSLVRRIRLVGAVTTTGQPWWVLQLLGYPGQRLIKRCIRVGAALRCKTVWLALHDIEGSTLDKRKKFLDRVERRFAKIR